MNQAPPVSKPREPKIVRNERIKLAANLLNTLSSACIVVGGITPIAAIAFGVPAGPTREPLTGLVIATAFIAVGSGLHWVAQKLLGELE